MLTRIAPFAILLTSFISFSVHAGDVAEKPSPALLLWQQGQEAMRLNNTDLAINLYCRSLKLDANLACNHLSLAASYLEKGEDEKAASSMKQYLEARPDHLAIRLHYAELLSRLQRPTAARDQLERFIADAQQMPELQERLLVDGHSRLMELAVATEDAYREHLHRGIGLYLLGCHLARVKEQPKEASAEGLLCRAAAELTLARLDKPGSARPAYYLHEVWSQLAQNQPATRWLRAAQAAAPFSDLTPTERRRLDAAYHDLRAETLHR